MKRNKIKTENSPEKMNQTINEKTLLEEIPSPTLPRANSEVKRLTYISYEEIRKEIYSKKL
jgi:hypothetical protein